MEILVSVGSIVAAAYVGLCALLFFRQGSYVYYPSSDVRWDPGDVGLAYEEVALQTEDGESLAAWFVPASGDARTLLFCHGNAGNMGDRIGSLKTFHDLGLNVFLFDYRGFGKSTGTPGEAGTYLDAEAAWEYLVNTRGIPAQRIIVFGRSLGGAIACRLAGDVHPGVLVMESAFTSAPDMAQRLYPYLPARRVCRFRYDSMEGLRRVSCPVLIGHGKADRMIPYAHAESLFKAAREPKELVPFPGGHNDGGMDGDPEYRARFVAFLDRVLPADAGGGQ